MSLLRINNLEVNYYVENGKVHALRGLDLELNKGQSLGIVGETGAGKTTMAFSILGLLPKGQSEVAKGEIWWQERNILTLKEKEMENIRGKEIAMIFQDPMTSLNPMMKVDEQVAEVISIHHPKLPKTECLRRAMDQLRSVGIQAERCAEYPHQFSGGMKQRVVIAIALACSPQLLIADEPTTALDVTIQSQVLELMKLLMAERDTSLIMITHDLGVVAELCDTIAIMYAGEVVEYGERERLFAHPHHPYTRGLLASIPDVTEEKDRLDSIPGLPPEVTAEIHGCCFAPRCPRRQENCDKQRPVLDFAHPKHSYACFHPWTR